MGKDVEDIPIDYPVGFYVLSLAARFWLVPDGSPQASQLSGFGQRPVSSPDFHALGAGPHYQDRPVRIAPFLGHLDAVSLEPSRTRVRAPHNQVWAMPPAVRNTPVPMRAEFPSPIPKVKTQVRAFMCLDSPLLLRPAPAIQEQGLAWRVRLRNRRIHKFGYRREHLRSLRRAHPWYQDTVSRNLCRSVAACFSV